MPYLNPSDAVGSVADSGQFYILNATIVIRERVLAGEPVLGQTFWPLSVPLKEVEKLAYCTLGSLMSSLAMRPFCAKGNYPCSGRLHAIY